MLCFGGKANLSGNCVTQRGIFDECRILRNDLGYRVVFRIPEPLLEDWGGLRARSHNGCRLRATRER